MQFKNLKVGDFFILPEEVHDPYCTNLVTVYQKLADQKLNGRFIPRTNPECTFLDMPIIKQNMRVIVLSMSQCPNHK